jgi:hypothetical protein
MQLFSLLFCNVGGDVPSSRFSDGEVTTPGAAARFSPMFCSQNAGVTPSQMSDLIDSGHIVPNLYEAKDTTGYDLPQGSDDSPGHQWA